MMTAQVLDAKPHSEDISTGIGKDAREAISDSLEAILGDTMLLQVKSQVYHWNVVGPTFFSLHKLTEEHYNELFGAVDVIAERIRALGKLAPLSFKALSSDALLKEESKLRNAADMVHQLVKDHEKLAREIRKAAGSAEESGDYVTHDMLTQRLTFHEKAIWMLRSIVA